MKVVHIVTRHLGRRYGAAANIAHWIDWERRHGCDVVLVAGPDAPEEPLPGVPLRIVDSLVRDIDPLNDLRALRHLRRILIEERPQVVHTHHSKAGILGRLAVPRGMRPRAGTPGPAGVEVWHTVHMASFGPAYGFASPVFRQLERMCARRTTELIAVGDELRRRYLAAGIGDARHFRVVNSPAGVERHLAIRDWDEDRRADIRRAWDVAASARLVLTAGLLEDRKRHALVIDALAPVLRRGEATLLIAGDGPLHDALRTQIDGLGLTGSVRLLGYVEAFEELLAIADVYVHAARVEGVPQTVLQAVAAGVPVVATAVEGLRELPGSPVRVTAGDGSGLAAEVGQILRGSLPTRVASESVTPWTASAVAGEIARLHAERSAREAPQEPAPRV